VITEDDLIELEESTRIEICEESDSFRRKILYWVPCNQSYEIYILNFAENLHKTITLCDKSEVVNLYNTA